MFQNISSFFLNFFRPRKLNCLPCASSTKTRFHGEGVEHFVVSEHDSSASGLFAFFDVELGLGEGKQIGTLQEKRKKEIQ